MKKVSGSNQRKYCNLVRNSEQVSFKLSDMEMYRVVQKSKPLLELLHFAHIFIDVRRSKVAGCYVKKHTGFCKAVWADTLNSRRNCG